MTQNAMTVQAAPARRGAVLPADQSAGERAALWVHRIVILLAFVMVFFPPFNPGRISSKISGNLTLMTSATAFGTITTKLKAFMVPGLRFALNKTAKCAVSACGCRWRAAC